jgi:uncharacterized protein (DUF1684 family)
MCMIRESAMALRGFRPPRAGLFRRPPLLYDGLMKSFILAACLVALPAFGSTPEQDWKAAIADENRDYAQVPHAMLKIQDAAYVGEGEAATLSGREGDPASWHWHMDSKTTTSYQNAPLRIAFHDGKLAVTLNGKPVAGIDKSIVVDSDVDVRGEPTQVGAGVNGWRVFVYNQKNPAAMNFTGVAYYPFDPAFRVQARFIPDPKLTPRTFRTSRGTDKQFFHGGDAVFTLKGKHIILPFYADDSDPAKIKDMSAFYTDALTGKGAYGAGRYVDIANFGKYPPANVVVDFNQAYNPNCARSAFFTCPVAVDNIELAMTAGERDPHSLH